jgi:hypothetical protein
MISIDFVICVLQLPCSVFVFRFIARARCVVSCWFGLGWAESSPVGLMVRIFYDRMCGGEKEEAVEC